MNEKTAQILKADKVTFEGNIQLDANKPALSRSGKSGPSCPPQPRIVEDTGEYVVIEAACSCGRKMLLKCTYKSS